MQKFTKAAIDERRQDFKRRFSDRSASLGKYSFSYFLLPQELNPDLPDFAYRCTGEPNDGYVIGVSNSVAPVYRPLWAFHEYFEFAVLGIDAHNRCGRAMEEEINIARAILVPQSETDTILADYFRRRTLFFDNLVRYAEANRHSFDEPDIRQFRVSRSILETLVQVSDDSIKTV